MERRKIFFTDEKKDILSLIITDAPKEELEKWCFRYKEAVQEGRYGRGREVESFDTLKVKYYVRELLTGLEEEVLEDIALIGYEEAYNYSNFTGAHKKVEGFRTIELYAGMTGEYELISTNAPDAVIKANLQYVSELEETGQTIENPYAVIEAMGFTANVLGSQDDFDSEEKESAIIDASFDYYNI